MFRYKRSVPLDYDRQGYLYFHLRRYKQLSERQQATIRQVCRDAGGAEYAPALLAFLTEDAGATTICNTYYLSRSTLERLVVRCYVLLDERV